MQTPYEGTWAVLVVDDSEEGMIIDMLFCKTMKKGEENKKVNWKDNMKK